MKVVDMASSTTTFSSLPTIFLVLLSLFLLHLPQNVGSIVQQVAPTIDAGNELVIRTLDQQFFKLRCEGSEPMSWRWTTALPSDLAVITNETQANPDRPFVSILTVNDPYSEDTGYYKCHYKDGLGTAASTDTAASTYVYVYDGESVFVDVKPTGMSVSTNEKLLLDCKTTLPDTRVTLTRNGVDITWQARFNPREGFLLLNVVVQDAGLYICQASETGQMKTIQVHITSSETGLPSPTIEVGPNQHFASGLPFALNCTLDKVGVEVTVALHWSYPNVGAKYETILTKEGEGEDRMLVLTLYVPSASHQDTGIYTCSASAQHHNPASNSKHIVIKDEIEPFVNITTSSETIEVNVSDTVSWRAEVVAFPPDLIITYTDWRGDVLRQTDRISSWYDPPSASSWLSVTNITTDDFGKYTLTASTRDGSAAGNASVILHVKSAPTVDIRGVPEYLPPGRMLHLSCLVQGFPLPTLTWEFESCINGPSLCVPVPNAVTEEGQSNPSPGNLVLSRATLNPSVSGHLHCRANNSLTTNSSQITTTSTTHVTLSDIDGVLVFRHTGLTTTTELIATTTTLTVVTRDDFSIMCGANKLHYKTLELLVPSASNLTIRANESRFSLLKEAATERVTKGAAGLYSCTGHPHNQSLQAAVRSVEVIVLEEAPAKFLPDANMAQNGTVTVKEDEPYFLNCTVEGTPTPVIKWKKDDQSLSHDSYDFVDGKTTILSDDMQRLELKYVFKSKHVGVYTCWAENRVGRVTGTLRLTVYDGGLTKAGRIGLSAALIGLLILTALVVFLMRRVKTERRFRKSFRQNELYLFEKGNIGQLNPDCSVDEQAELLPYGREWEVERDRITIGKQLGSGAFGRVVKASVTGLDGPGSSTVAIKMCKSQADASQVRALTLELKIMIHLGKHLNIVNLMGANTVHIGKGELWILVEYCRFGNLLVFMHRHRRNFINQINQQTGRIDHSILTLSPNPNNAVSQLSPGIGQGRHATSSGSNDGFSAMTHGAPITLSAPPEGRHASTNQAHNPLYCGTTNTITETEGKTKQQAPGQFTADIVELANHHQQKNIGPVLGGGGGGTVGGGVCRGGGVETETQTVFQAPAVDYNNRSNDDDFCGKSDTTRATLLSSQGSTGRVQNTYLSSLTSAGASSSSTSSRPHGSLSPLDSTLGDIGLLVDSHGQPIHEVGSVPGVNAPFTTGDLVCWAWQVAQGMDYLARRKVLHGDLAARNLLLADDNVVKISDFGLSREMYKKDVYMKKGDDLMPIKWISVEAIRDRIFSVQSDVWAFGVTLWEIFSLGSTPYPGIEVNQDFLKLLEDGYRMEMPRYANQDIYNLLLWCWNTEPQERPSFKQAAECLGELLLPDIKGEYIDMNNQYIQMNEERFKEQTDYLNMCVQPDYANMITGRTEEEEVDVRQHYINMQGISAQAVNPGPSSSSPSPRPPSAPTSPTGLHIQSPDVVSYCNMSTFQPRQRAPTTTTSTIQPFSFSQPHYLPMEPSRRSPSLPPPPPPFSPDLVDDVFSPKPNQPESFNFLADDKGRRGGGGGGEGEGGRHETNPYLRSSGAYNSNENNNRSTNKNNNNIKNSRNEDTRISKEEVTERSAFLEYGN